MSNNNSYGILGLIGCAALLFAAYRFFPSLSTILLTIGGIAILLVVLLVVLVVYFAFRKPKGKAEVSAAENGTTVIAKARAELVEVRRQGMRVKETRVRKLSEEICTVADQIFRALKEQPERLPKARQFLNYYLPTLGTILRKYTHLEQSGVPGMDLTEDTVLCLQNIKTALGKQYASLFEGDLLDLSLEIEVLNQICKRDGLLTDADLPPEEEALETQEEQNITLTL